MPSSRRAVLTGMGLVTPLGLDLASCWSALRAGRSGVRTLHSFDPSPLPVRIGAEIDGFDARHYLDKKDRKSLKMMVRTIQFGVAAARLALDDGGLDRGGVDPERFGVEFGTGTIPGEMADLGPAARAACAGGPIDLRKWGAEGMAQIPPMWMLNHVPNMPACHVSILNDARGPNNTIVQSDAAGLFAIGEAFRIIQRGTADLMLAGGADTKANPVSMVRHTLFGELSHRNDEPERASRPFDRDRDGMVLGEGAGAVLLEERDHALRRGARVDAEVLGYGSAFDRGRTGRGLARAVLAALDEAGLDPSRLHHVNAHGDGTRDGDSWEARGLREALGIASPPVLAVKSYWGNLGSGSGAAELVVSLLAVRHGLLPGTLNYDHPDPHCPIVVSREPLPLAGGCFLKVARTERGQCAALLCRGGG